MLHFYNTLTRRHEEFVPLEEVQVPGVESFGEKGITIRMSMKTLPLKQWDVARELRRRIKLRFDQEGIEIPFPHQTVYWGEGQHPPALVSMGAPAAGETDDPSSTGGNDGP